MSTPSGHSHVKPGSTPEPGGSAHPVSLSKEQVIEHLHRWVQLREAFDAKLDVFFDLTGAMPDCDLLAPVYAVANAYTELVASTVSDRDEWLLYYQYECEMGRKPKRVTWTDIHGAHDVLLDSIEKLYAVITG